MKFIRVLFLSGSLLGCAGISLKAQEPPQGMAYLKAKTGKWSVTMTLRPTAASPAQVLPVFIAERQMLGEYCLHEVMRPAPSSVVPDFTRIADLAWNKNELRWDYMSIDTRITAGIMYFTYQRDHGDTIVSVVNSFPDPGMGPELLGKGKAVFARNEVIRISDDHDLVKQYWRFFGEPEWLAIQYDYKRM